MRQGFSRGRVMVLVLWALSLAAIPFWMHSDAPGWDSHIYASALRSIQAGHDPYADGMAAQRDFHDHLALHPNAPPPYTYLYSPITLPLLRLIGVLPGWAMGSLYWMIYGAAVLAQIWVVMQATKPVEWPYFAFAAPVAIFFPGLLVRDVVLSGNVAYILYGLLFTMAVVGWRRGQWLWFYLAIVVASCFKIPFLSLLVIPVLSARRQWVQAGVTVVAGIALFAVQPLLWPSLFHNYLQTIALEFSFNRGFGVGPAGILGHILTYLGYHYSLACTIFYLLYAVPVLALLMYLSRRFLRGNFPLTQWMPVLLVGAILLNPRVMAYDIAPVGLLMLLMGWRFLRGYTSVGRTIAVLAVIFVTTNAAVLVNPDCKRIDLWKFIEGVEIVMFFAAGCWNLLQRGGRMQEGHDAGEVLTSTLAA